MKTVTAMGNSCAPFRIANTAKLFGTRSAEQLCIASPPRSSQRGAILETLLACATSTLRFSSKYESWTDIALVGSSVGEHADWPCRKRNRAGGHHRISRRGRVYHRRRPTDRRYPEVDFAEIRRRGKLVGAVDFGRLRQEPETTPREDVQLAVMRHHGSSGSLRSAR